MVKQNSTDKRRRRPIFASKKPVHSPAANDDLFVRLDEVTRSMRLMMYVVITAAGALREQNVDGDAAVAQVLRRCCSDKLDQEIEKSESLLSKVAPSRKENLVSIDAD